MKPNVTPLFLFSLPRAGSTLLQRMLASHTKVCSAAEPWVMLPLVYSLKREGVYAEYNHFQAARAIYDFCQELPNGVADYNQSMHDMVATLYTQASEEDATYFLDKTPPYCMITKEILEIFPESKAIFLFREPGAVAASLMETFNEGRWSIPAWRSYLYMGLKNILEAYEINRDRIIAVRYEDLIADPESKCREMCEYLDLPYEEEMISGFSNVKFKGGMGDTTGRKNYKEINKAPLEKWKKTLGNPLRKRWYRSYLNWIGAERLALMGYDIDEMRKAIDEAPSRLRLLVSDSFRMMKSTVFDLIEPHMMKKKLRLLRKRHEMHRHY